MAKTFVIGDIHGAYKALIQCLQRSGFDYNEDILICLGDVCDGWPEVNKSIDELLRIKSLTYILGNHDDWALNWFESGEQPRLWLLQGGQATVESYAEDIPQSHIQFIKNGLLYEKLNNKVFVHGGLDIAKPIEEQHKETCLWDRRLVRNAFARYLSKQELNITGYEEVYIGHTPTLNYGINYPVKICEIYMMDTGAGWPGGYLSIMNIFTHEYFMSDRVDTLYPEYRGRGH
ncbi:MAG: metallophosphoesterase [Bacteroidales bacterium]|nr:metallophosphoesterase [Bacteroidales bacterium]